MHTHAYKNCEAFTALVSQHPPNSNVHPYIYIYICIYVPPAHPRVLLISQLALSPSAPLLCRDKRQPNPCRPTCLPPSPMHLRHSRTASNSRPVRCFCSRSPKCMQQIRPQSGKCNLTRRVNDLYEHLSNNIVSVGRYLSSFAPPRCFMPSTNLDEGRPSRTYLDMHVMQPTQTHRCCVPQGQH